MAVSKPKVKATICIPTYNGEEYIDDLLRMVLRQKLAFTFEVLVIDSGSTDKTLGIIEKYTDVTLHKIPNSEFGHGKTRNLAAQMANGEFVVFLSQDAVPAHDRWLEFMLEPFLVNEKVFCVLGKQTPRPFCDVTTKREVSSVFNSLGPDHSIMISRKNSLFSNEDAGSYLTFFSDVNSAIKKEYLLNKIPYRDVPYSEDQLLGKDVLDNGYLKAYAPLGNVFHSNEYTLREYFYRKHDEYMAMFQTLGVVPPHSIPLRIKRVLGDTARDLVFTVRDKKYSVKRKGLNILTSPIRNVLKEYVAHLVSKESHRKKVGSRYSLEAKRVPTKN